MILEVLQRDMVAAMKARDVKRKAVLSTLVGAVKKAGIDKGQKENIKEDIVDAALLKEQKTVQEMLDTCPTERTDLIELYTYNLDVIKEYTPQLVADKDEIKKMILTIADGEITKDKKGLIMKGLKGKVDMKIANQVVTEMIK